MTLNPFTYCIVSTIWETMARTFSNFPVMNFSPKNSTKMSHFRIQI